MKNFVQPGDTLTIPAPVAVLSGDPVIAGDIKGIACCDAAGDAPVDVKCSGVFTLPKVAANAFVLGAKVYWAAGTKLATSTASGNMLLGVAVADAPATAATVNIRLSGF